MRIKRDIIGIASTFAAMFGKIAQLFKSEEPLKEPLDFGVLGTDVHSHFIPGIDDGSKDMEMSLALLEGMASFGYKKVITTPHVMSDMYKNTPEIITKGCDDLRRAIDASDLEIEVECAAEYYLDIPFGEKVKKKDLLTFGDNHVLFELPFTMEPPNTADVIFEMQLGGFKPVLAHPERYGFWFSEFEKYEQMNAKGVLLQLNINSLTGHYGPEVKKMAERLIDEGLISLLGSDCHHMGHIEGIDHARRLPYLHKLVASGKLLNNKL